MASSRLLPHCWRLPLLAVAGLVATLPWAMSVACVQYNPRVYRPSTLGQELIDLKTAHEKGLLSDAEYADETARARERFRAIDREAIDSKDLPAKAESKEARDGN